MRIHETETFASGDQNGNLKNRDSKNACFPCVNDENKYFNENRGLRLPIVTCTFHKMLDFIVTLLLVTVPPHRTSKQTVSSC